MPLFQSKPILTRSKPFLALSVLALAALPLLTRLLADGAMSPDWGIFPPPRSANVAGFHRAVFFLGAVLALLIVACLLFPRRWPGATGHRWRAAGQRGQAAPVSAQARISPPKVF